MSITKLIDFTMENEENLIAVQNELFTKTTKWMKS